MRRVLGKWCGARPVGGGVTSSTVVGGARVPCRGCGAMSAGGQRRPPLRMTRKFVQARERAGVGSELSAAGGRGSEVSEWLRSKFQVAAVRQRRNFGHRNRIIGPYGGFTDRIS